MIASSSHGVLGRHGNIGTIGGGFRGFARAARSCAIRIVVNGESVLNPNSINSNATTIYGGDVGFDGCWGNTGTGCPSSGSSSTR